MVLEIPGSKGSVWGYHLSFVLVENPTLRTSAQTFQTDTSPTFPKIRNHSEPYATLELSLLGNSLSRVKSGLTYKGLKDVLPGIRMWANLPSGQSACFKWKEPPKFLDMMNLSIVAKNTACPNFKFVIFW